MKEFITWSLFMLILILALFASHHYYGERGLLIFFGVVFTAIGLVFLIGGLTIK